MLKLAFFVYVFLYAVVLAVAGLLWWVISSTGLVHNVEDFLRDVGFNDFQFRGGQLFQATALAGAVLVVAGALLTTLAAAVVNLISELTGGLQLVVIEERTSPSETAERDGSGGASLTEAGSHPPRGVR